MTDTLVVCGVLVLTGYLMGMETCHLLYIRADRAWMTETATRRATANAVPLLALAVGILVLTVAAIVRPLLQG